MYSLHCTIYLEIFSFKPWVNQQVPDIKKTDFTWDDVFVFVLVLA